jgi:hypothetical protein
MEKSIYGLVKPGFIMNQPGCKSEFPAILAKASYVEM